MERSREREIKGNQRIPAEIWAQAQGGENVYNLAMREVAKRHISQVLSIERAERKDRTNLRR